MNSFPPLCYVFLHTATLAYIYIYIYIALSETGIVGLHYWPTLLAMQINPTLPVCLISMLYQTEQNLVLFDCCTMHFFTYLLSSTNKCTTLRLKLHK